MARKHYERKKDDSFEEIFFIIKGTCILIFGLLLFGMFYNAGMWYEENKELIWSAIIFFIVLVIGFVIYKVYKNKRKRIKMLDSMSDIQAQRIFF